MTKYCSFTPGRIWDAITTVTHINSHGGSILFHGNTYYWFGSQAGNKWKGASEGFAGVHCYSSTDLYNWRDEGLVLPVVKDTKHKLGEGCIIADPWVIYNHKTDRFVMWFHHEFKGQGYSTARSGLAVSDSPTGPFQYLHSIRPNQGVWPINVRRIHKKPITDTLRGKFSKIGRLRKSTPIPLTFSADISTPDKW